MQRRGFIKLLASGVAISISPSLIKCRLIAEDGRLYKSYERVKLVDGDNQPIRVSKLKKEVTYIFHYPYVATPSLLIDLNEKTKKDVRLKSEDGIEYIWSGGVGKSNSIVAYSGICSHQLTHPTPKSSFIRYVAKSEKTLAYSRGGVIVCASHMTAFDSSQGCKNLAGKASEPLASIILEEEKDELYAVGVLGPDQFQEYFLSFKDEFKEFYGSKRAAKKDVKMSAKLVELSDYSKEILVF